MGVAEMILLNEAFKDVPGNIYYRSPKWCKKCGKRIEESELEWNEHAEYCHNCRLEKESKAYDR